MAFSVYGGKSLERLICLLMKVEALEHVISHDFIEDGMFFANQVITKLDHRPVLGLQECK